MKKTHDPSILDTEWLPMLYEQVGRELSLARESQRETHTWIITLTAGVLTAFVTLGGTSFTYPTENLFLGVLLLTPLFFRFFVRSCLEYQIFHRWTTLRNALDQYFYFKASHPEKAKSALEYLKEIIPLYYFSWKAAKKFRRMIWDNIKLAYGWPLLIISSLLVWGFAEQCITQLIRYALFIFVPWMLIEIFLFFKYPGFKYAQPQHRPPSYDS